MTMFGLLPSYRVFSQRDCSEVVFSSSKPQEGCSTCGCDSSNWEVQETQRSLHIRQRVGVGEHMALLVSNRLPTCQCVQVNYWPSNVEHSGETQQPKYQKTFYSSEQISGQRVKADLPFVGDDYIQAGDRIRSMDEGRSASIALMSQLV